MEEGFGIGRLSIIPVRAEGNDRSEIVTQILFGEHYTVLAAHSGKKWIRVRLYYDGYEGWIDARQHTAISEEYFRQINDTDYKICLDETATLLYNKQPMTIVRGSILPIVANELFRMEEQLAFNGESKSLGMRQGEEFILPLAQKYLNAPYLWGGRTPFGIDCSGLTQMVFRIQGWPLSRDASQQAREGQAVSSLDESKAGDLAFFASAEGKITHVGIVMDNARIIHASGRVRIDNLSSEGIREVETGRLTHHLHSIRRILRF